MIIKLKNFLFVGIIAFVLLAPISVNALEANPESIDLYGTTLTEIEIIGEISEYLSDTRLVLTVIAPDNSQREYDVRIIGKGVFSQLITISEDWEDGNYVVYGKYGDVDLGTTSFLIEEPYDPRTESKKSIPITNSLEIPAPFIDTTLDPQHYVDRYNNELIYKKWFDDNYPEYSSIYQAVGLEEPKNQKEPRFSDDVLNELDRKSQSCPTYECQLSIMYSQIQYVNEQGYSFSDDNYGVNSNPISESKPTCGAGTELINGVCQTIQTTNIGAVCGQGTIEKNGQCVPDPNYVPIETREKMQQQLIEKLCAVYDNELENLRQYGYSEASNVYVDLSTEEIIEEIKYLKKEMGCKKKSPSSLGGGCLIATATYGSELAPQVQQLREIRDNSLLSTESGTNFMNTFNDVYYSFSPVIADYERENPVFKEMVKIAITPMITSLSLMEYADSESSVLSIGISLIVLNGLMYVGMPVLAVMRFRK